MDSTGKFILVTDAETANQLIASGASLFSKQNSNYIFLNDNQKLFNSINPNKLLYTNKLFI